MLCPIFWSFEGAIALGYLDLLHLLMQLACNWPDVYSSHQNDTLMMSKLPRFHIAHSMKSSVYPVFANYNEYSSHFSHRSSNINTSRFAVKLPVVLSRSNSAQLLGTLATLRLGWLICDWLYPFRFSIVWSFKCLSFFCVLLDSTCAMNDWPVSSQDAVPAGFQGSDYGVWPVYRYHKLALVGASWLSFRTFKPNLKVEAEHANDWVGKESLFYNSNVHFNPC